MLRQQLFVHLAAGAAALAGVLPMQNVIAGAYDEAVLASGPEAYWRFEDASADPDAMAADATGRHHGTYTDGATLVVPPLGGQAARFDGNTQHVTTTTLGSVGSSLGSAATFEFLFRSTDTAQDRIFGAFNAGTNTSVTIASNSNEQFGATPGKTQLFLRRQATAGSADLEASFDMSVVNI